MLFRSDATGLNRLLQGAVGQGLFQKIMDGYTSIAHVYEPGDQIYLFGFSRGAYTVRSLAGMIANCGLPSGSFTNDCVTQAFTAYRNPAQRKYSLTASIRSAGAKCDAKAKGKPSLAASCALKRLEPRSQIGRRNPAPGTARTLWPGLAGAK